MSKKFPGRRHLTTAFFSAICCSAAAFIMFLTNPIKPSSFIIALSWSVFIFSTDVNFIFTALLKGISGIILGSTFGWIVTQLEILTTGKPLQYFISTLYAFPFALLIATTDPVVNSPLARFISIDRAFMGLYMIGTFSGRNPTSSALNVIASLVIAAGIIALVALIFRLVFRRWGTLSRIKKTVDDLSDASADFFDILINFTACGDDHSLAIRKRAEVFESRVLEFTSLKSSFDLSVWTNVPIDSLDGIADTIVVMRCHISGLHRAGARAYSKNVQDFLWKPLQFNLAELSREVSRLLMEPHTNCSSTISQLCSEIYLQLIQVTCDFKPGEYNDTFHARRFKFSVLSALSYARLVEQFCSERDSVKQVSSSFSASILFEQFKGNISDLFKIGKWKASLIAESDDVSYRTQFKYLIKIALSHQIIMHACLIWHSFFQTGISFYAKWTAFAFLSCLNSTVGGSTVKGSRLLVGTVCGGCLGLLSVCITSDRNIEALQLQLFIVCFFGKLLSFIPKIGNASCYATSTWVLVTLANWDTPLTSAQEFKFAAHRIILTTVGTLAAVALGLFFLPRFALQTYRTTLGNIVETSADLATVACEMFSSDFYSVDRSSSKDFESALKSCAEIRKLNNFLLSVREESAAELQLKRTSRLCFRSKSLIPSENLFSLSLLVDNIADCSTALFASASAFQSNCKVTSRIKALLEENLNEILQEIFSAKKPVAAALKIEGNKTIGAMNIRNSIFESLLKQWEILKSDLENEGSFREHLKDGLLYVSNFLYTLGEFVEAWNRIPDELLNKGLIDLGSSFSLRRGYNSKNVEIIDDI